MAFIEALAAFALAMIVFATMVTAIVELVHRVMRLREKGLQQMIARLSEEALKSHVAGNVTEAAKALAKQIAKKPGIVATFNLLPRAEAALTPVEFVERLARTDVGTAIAREVKERRDQLVEDLALRFERYGDSVRTAFAQRAQVMSIVIAIVLALAANISVDRLFLGLLNNEPARAALLAAADQITADFRIPAPTDGTPPNPPIDPQDARKLADDAKRTLEDTRARLADLAGKDLAIGWAYFPGCRVALLTTKAEIERAVSEGRILRLRDAPVQSTAQSPAPLPAQPVAQAPAQPPAPLPAQPAAQATAQPSNLAADKPGAPPQTKSVDLREHLKVVQYAALVRDPACADVLAKLTRKIETCVQGNKVPTGATADHLTIAETCLPHISLSWWETADLSWGRFFVWAVMCIVAGLLIGLGGPFWFNVYASLSQVLQVAKAMRESLKPAAKTDDAAPAAAAPGQAIRDGAIRPATPSEAFERAIAATTPEPLTGRLHLDSTGKPVG